jgi:hypothetical protein
MVRDYQAIRRNERAASARIKTDARFLEMLEPLRRRLELIFFLDLFKRGIVEEPHAFIGEGGGAKAC